MAGCWSRPWHLGASWMGRDSPVWAGGLPAGTHGEGPHSAGGFLPSTGGAGHKGTPSCSLPFQAEVGLSGGDPGGGSSANLRCRARVCGNGTVPGHGLKICLKVSTSVWPSVSSTSWCLLAPRRLISCKSSRDGPAFWSSSDRSASSREGWSCWRTSHLNPWWGTLTSSSSERMLNSDSSGSSS